MLKLITKPTVPTVTTAEAKAWLRVDHSADDSLIDAIVKGATEKIELMVGRKLLNQTWQLWLDRVPCDGQDVWWEGTREGALGDTFGAKNEIDLQLAPVSAISSFTYYDRDNTSFVFDPTNYF